MKQLLRWLPLLLVILIVVLSFVFGWHEFLNFQTLQAYYQQLHSYTVNNYSLSVLAFMLVYALIVTFSIPGAVFITLLGGFLFGVVAGTFYVVISATVGATLIFLIVQTAVGQWLAKKASGWVMRMEQGFQRDAFNYLLFLRLVPIFPFWVVNIVAAVLNVRLRAYFFATLFGIVPGSAVYVSVGNGLSSLIQAGKAPDLGVIFQPKILLPLVLLAVLSLVPVIYKKLKTRTSC